MFSITIFALLVRLAAAAHSIDFQLTQGKSPLDVIASVTNSGDSDISVMKLSPILSTIPVKHFRVFDGQGGSELSFRGLSAFFDLEGAGADAWESIAAGQTVNRSIDLSASHEFKSAGKYTLWANGQFQVLGSSYSAKALQSQSLVPYSRNMTILLTDGDVVESTERKLFQKRVSVGACDSGQAGIIRDDFAGAKRLATRAIERTRAIDNHFSQFYHTTEAHYVDFVADTFQKIEDASTVSTTSNIVANCNGGSPTVCTANVVAYASFVVGTEGKGSIYTCAPYWTLPPFAQTCSGYGRADILVHELSHFYDTDDIAYGYDAAQNLTPAQAAHNADTYMFYARSLNC